MDKLTEIAFHLIIVLSLAAVILLLVAFAAHTLKEKPAFTEECPEGTVMFTAHGELLCAAPTIKRPVTK